MRLAVIADIHGNLDALRAVLSDLQAQGAQEVIVNGDVVNRGPDSVAAMQTLLERERTTFLLGNHDDLTRLWHARSEQLPADWFDDPFWGATAWTTEELHRAGLLHVPAGWPMTLTLGTGPERVHLAHGSAQDYREGLSERTKPARVSELAAGPDGIPHAVLVGSHIHRQGHAQFGPTTVLNTGAVGTPADGDPRAAYLLLTHSRGGWTPELRRVPYDRSGVLRRFETSGLLSRGLSAEIFRAEVQTSRSLYTPYWLWTERAGLPRTPHTWERFLGRVSQPAG